MASTTQLRTAPTTVEHYLAQLTPRAARSYLAGYARAGLPVPLTEYQHAIVRARAGVEPDEDAGSEASEPSQGPLHLSIA